MRTFRDSAKRGRQYSQGNIRKL